MEDWIYEKTDSFLSAYDVMCKDEVNILHLSDLHFGIEKADKKIYKVDVDRQARTLKSLINTLKDDTKVPPNWKPDVVVISGDIGWTGNHEEYDKFREVFLRPLLKEFSNLSKEKIITCPGNHDIIWDNVKGFEKPHSNPSIEVEIIDRESIKNVRKKHFQDYVDFFHGGDPQKMVASIRFEEWPWLCFLVMNSAWDCRDKEDEGTLRVGLELLEEISSTIDRENEKEKVVALFHHPHTEVSDINVKDRKSVTRNWLHVSERRPQSEDSICFSTYVDDIADFVLNGHIHIKTEPLHSRTGKSIQLISGTAYSKDSFKYHCRILKVSREDESLYIDIENTLAKSQHLWDTSTPKNFRTLGVIAKKWNRLEQRDKQKKELLEMKKAWQECKMSEKNENMRRALIQLMHSLYPDVFDKKLENQSITDEIIDEIINRIDQVINRLKLRT